MELPEHTIIYQQGHAFIELSYCERCARYFLQKTYKGGVKANTCAVCSKEASHQPKPLYTYLDYLLKGWIVPDWPSLPITHKPIKGVKTLTVGWDTLSYEEWSQLLGKGSNFLANINKLYSEDYLVEYLTKWLVGYRYQLLVASAAKLADDLFNEPSGVYLACLGLHVTSAGQSLAQEIVTSHPKAKGLLIRGIWQSYTDWSAQLGKYPAYVSAMMRRHSEAHVIQVILNHLGW